MTLFNKNKDIYEQNATVYDQRRDKSLFEKKWLDVFLGHLNSGDKVLDLGCGSGEPIASYLIEKGMNLTGVDYSQAMISIAKERFPNNKWYVQDMQKLNLEEKFKGIIAWNSFFHLTQEDQKTTFSLLTSYLDEGGIFMTTVGPEKGEVTGYVNKQVVYHASLSLVEYKELIHKNGLELMHFVPNDPDCNRHTVLMAKKC